VSLLAILTGLGLTTRATTGQTPRSLAPGTRVYLHAHNCYPERGRWTDRLARARGAGAQFLAIEQDLAWIAPTASAPGRSVVLHDRPPVGDEPTLETHFFEAVRPQMEEALAAPRPDTWPLLVLHLDFKTNEPEHHRAVWALLERHRRWLTTAPKRPHGQPPSGFTPGPLLVLTENGNAQERTFFDAVPDGSPLLIFGTVPPASLSLPDAPDARARAYAASAPELVMPERASSYRRWVNFPWSIVEAGGQANAGPWEPSDDARLRALVSRAHAMGLWVRFYTLNGHTGPGDGWTASYNFGSADAVALRWQAARRAGVDFIATDQYESFAADARRHP
jgi:hypothetical protein